MEDARSKFSLSWNVRWATKYTKTGKGIDESAVANVAGERWPEVRWPRNYE